MTRLTNKECYRYEDFVFSLRNKLFTTSEVDNSIYKKLKSLEDIEEELEIDLITLIKALRKGIYVKQYGQIEHYFLKLLSDGINLYLTNYGGTRVILSQDYYGKTWALTREELEND